MGNALTSKGQVTIPKSVRDYLGLEPGSEVDFVRGPAGEIVVRRSDGRVAESPLRRFVGHAGKGLRTDEIMALLRGEQ